MKKHNDKNSEQIFTIISRMAHAFASPARIKILQLLAQAPRSVESIALNTGESVANTSQHLQRLFAGGIVEVQKEKNERIYRLKSSTVALFLEILFDLANELSQDLKESVEQGIEINLDNLGHEIKEGKASLLDVREIQEADYSPVPLAHNIPLQELEERINELSKEKIYYIFCRGRYCPLANRAVALLQAHGFKAYSLQKPLSHLRRIV